MGRVWTFLPSGRSRALILIAKDRTSGVRRREKPAANRNRIRYFSMEFTLYLVYLVSLVSLVWVDYWTTICGPCIQPQRIAEAQY